MLNSPQIQPKFFLSHEYPSLEVTRYLWSCRSEVPKHKGKACLGLLIRIARYALVNLSVLLVKSRFWYFFLISNVGMVHCLWVSFCFLNFLLYELSGSLLFLWVTLVLSNWEKGWNTVKQWVNIYDAMLMLTAAVLFFFFSNNDYKPPALSYI